MYLEQLETPSLVTDLPVMERNLRRMQARCNELVVDLRPHAKTHKCVEIVERQMALGATGLTVAKTAEAEILFEAAGRDVLVANQVVSPAKIRRLFHLAQEGRVGVLFDSATGLARLEAEARRGLQPLDIYLEVNIADPTGRNGRCGATLGDEAVELARRAADSRGLRWRGILGYRGAPFLFSNAPSSQTVTDSGREEGEQLVAFAARLRDEGIPVERILAGSTPTALSAGAVAGVSEVHPGEYVFYGGIHAGPGVSSWDDCGLWVLATVVSAPHSGRAVLDAGKKALSGDIDPSLAPNLNLTGFGRLYHADGRPIAGATLTSLSEEHGVVSLSGPDRLAVGDQVRVVPNHVCPVVNLFNEMCVFDGEQIVDRWRVAARGAVH